jgi:hypothetical protein
MEWGSLRFLAPVMPREFWLSGSLKEKLQPTAVTNQNSLISAIVEFFSQALQYEPTAVDHNYMKQLHWVMNNGGQCYKYWHNRNPDWLIVPKVCIDYSNFWAPVYESWRTWRPALCFRPYCENRAGCQGCQSIITVRMTHPSYQLRRPLVKRIFTQRFSHVR